MEKTVFVVMITEHLRCHCDTTKNGIPATYFMCVCASLERAENCINNFYKAAQGTNLRKLKPAYDDIYGQECDCLETFFVRPEGNDYVRHYHITVTETAIIE